ncbi:MAG: SUF system Fe-S cluster assembly regulator [Hahellaceae bacterium]|nr:SUF system Fe-S cluster assembly regulator [Hahellaceae bacterium]
MLRLAKLADYGLVIAASLVEPAGGKVKLEQVAETTKLSVPTVRKIMKLLVDGGVVRSERGVNGGYVLARAPQRISVAEIVQAVEGGVALTDCCRDDNHCDVMHACTVQTNWTVINQTVNTLFSRITLSDMTRPLTSRDLMQKIQGNRLELVAVES